MRILDKRATWTSGSSQATHVIYLGAILANIIKPALTEETTQNKLESTANINALIRIIIGFNVRVKQTAGGAPIDRSVMPDWEH